MDFSQFSPGRLFRGAVWHSRRPAGAWRPSPNLRPTGKIIPYSRNSTPLSFNGVEARDIVKGPVFRRLRPAGPWVLAATVNLVPKTPYFDRPASRCQHDLGYWTSGHSHANPETTLDFGGHASTTGMAYRVSYLGRWGSQYYLNARDETQDGLCGAHLPSAQIAPVRVVGPDVRRSHQ